MARPTKLTTEIQAKIVEAIGKGAYVAVAAESVGITAATFYNWMKRGSKAKSGQFFEFFDAIKKAEAEAETKQIGTILVASASNWQAAAWWLERKFPQRWGRKDRMPVSEDDVDREIERELARLAGKSEAGDAQAPAHEADATSGSH